ncbi:MAG: cupin domain-containing protein [Gammaproteobacteria bacterium]|nr:cupin domain-containing protein [Gammaproteobacteria bacterium]
MKSPKSYVRNPVLGLIAAIVIAGGISAGSTRTQAANTTDSSMELSEVLTIGLEEVDWIPFDLRDPDGLAMATLWGDPNSGPFGGLFRVPPGFESPMHVHSRGERIVQIKGTSIHWGLDGDRQSARVLKPGDYFQMPGGVPHVSATADEESIEFITMDGAFDYAPTEQ